MTMKNPMPGRISGAVDLRTLKGATALSPFDQVALRKNLEAGGNGGLMPPDSDGVVPPDNPTPVGLYARFSSGKQKESSIERQIKVVTAYMRMRGYVIYVLYDDPAKSGRWMRNRKGLQRLLDDCRNKKIKVIMVEDFDRWSRETYDAVEVCEELNNLGVEFHSAGDFKALNKREVIEAAIKAEADKDRRTLIMGMGRFQHAAQGGAHSGEFFGYRYGPQEGFLVQHDKEAATIRTVFEMAAAGMSFRNIGRIMKERKVPGPTENCKWNKGTVGNILGQLAYTGRIYYPFSRNVFDRNTGKITKKPRHPSEMTRNQFEHLRIVSDEVFFAVNTKRQLRGKNKWEHASFLTGKATCDCSGVEGQQFTMGGRQMACSVWNDGDGCPARRSSVMHAPVEHAVLSAVCDKLRSLVDEEDFASAFDRSMREVAVARSKARDGVERRIEEILARLTEMLRRELQHKYPSEVMAAEQERLQLELAKNQTELVDLAELPIVEDAEERLRTLSATLDHLLERVPFRAETPAEAAVSAALARLVRRVVVMREGRRRGTMRLAIHLDFLAFLHEEGGATGDDGLQVIHVDVEQPLGTRDRLRDDAERLRAIDAHRIDDARWGMVADRLPDVTSHREDSRDISTRDLVDALLLRLRTSLPILSKTLGDTLALERALTRFIYAAGDQILIDILREADPEFVAGLDLRPLEVARQRWKVGGQDWRKRRGPAARLQALDGRDALTDEQWEASKPLLHPAVELSLKGTPGVPGRVLLEAVILALRTGLSWRRMPERFGGKQLLENTVRRFVRSGSWDRMLEMWTREFPELVDGLDVERFAKMRRGSAQWRGPSPRRSRYARNGGVAPAARRPRRADRRGGRARNAA